MEKGEAVDGVSPDQMEANAAALTLRHLITMSAGLQWNESYQSPFGITAKAYYGSDIEATMREVPVVVMPVSTRVRCEWSVVMAMVASRRGL